MATYNYSVLIQRIEDLVSNYHMSKAREELYQVKVDDVPAKFRAKFAQLARRVGDSKLSLRLLHPNVYGAFKPSNEDLIEYSSTLRKLGLINQALTLLTRVQNSPEVHIHKAFCYISRWDSLAAEKELEAYLNSPDKLEKKILVAKVNLVTCYIDTNRLDDAERLIDEIKPEVKEVSDHLFLNLKELQGQFYIRKGLYSEAIKVLREANRVSGAETGRTSLYIQKWLLVARCLNKELSSDSDEIKSFRKTIRENFHWETLRDFDWQMAKIDNDKGL
ncbi:MAG: hypothetical protein HRT44_11215, partial [Bdellovibrionales bacterium]|nr:hypothetical protein [Bdellovibrionales bacterium]NQZ19810.1 hypothetical protein [Bdellovibrionales bacterium]